MSDSIVLPELKVAELTEKLKSLQEGEWPEDRVVGQKPNLDLYILDPNIPRHYYERAVWQSVKGELALVAEYKRTHVVEEAWDKLADIIEGLENGPEQWKLVGLHPVAKRPGKTTGHATAVAIFRVNQMVALSAVPRTPETEQKMEDISLELEKAAEWEASLKKE